MTMRPLVLLALCVPLAGCGGYRGLETVHQPVVAQTDYTLDVLAGPDGLASGEAQRLRGWLDVLAPLSGASIAVDDPMSSPATRAEVGTLAAERGMRLSPVAASQGAPLSSGMVRIVVTRSTATVPSCDASVPRTALVNFDAHTSNGFGCAINGTLAAMVADPNDLVRGRSDSGNETGSTAAKAVSIWRKAVPTGGGGTIVKSESTGAR